MSRERRRVSMEQIERQIARMRRQVRAVDAARRLPQPLQHHALVLLGLAGNDLALAELAIRAVSNDTKRKN